MKLQRKLVIILSVLTTLVFSVGISNVMQQNKYGEFDRSEQQRQIVAGTEVNIENDKAYEEKKLASNTSKRANTSELYTSQELDEAEPENTETEIRTTFGAELIITNTYIMPRESGSSVNGVTTHYALGALRSNMTKYTANKISTITFKRGIDAPNGTEATWDVSNKEGSKEILAFVVPSSTVSGRYDLYIGTKGENKIYLPSNADSFFADYANLTEINGLELLSTSNVTRMNNMFYNTKNIKTIDVSNFDTSKVTDMSYMFARFFEGTSLTSIVGLENFNTSNVTRMEGMFESRANLTEINVSKFNTSNVTSMRSMFSDCRSLTKLDVSNFNTSNVTNMTYMFNNCRSLTKLDVSNFNTSNVTTMKDMFYYCESLTDLNVSNFNTSKVTDMSYMFCDCESLTDLNVSNFNTSKVTDMDCMFSYCTSLTKLDVSGFNTSNVTDMGRMFYDTNSIETIDVSNFDTSKVTDMSDMFAGSTKSMSLTSIVGIENFNTSNVTSMANMFYSCSSLTKLDVSNFNTSNVTNMTNMFYNCRSLTKLNVSNFDTSNVRTMHGIFNSCANLTDLNVSNFNTSKVTDMHYMFSDCSSLTKLDVSNFDTSKVTNMSYMFAGYDESMSSTSIVGLENFNTSNVTNMSYMFSKCKSLTDLNVSNFNTSKVTNMDRMFYNCSSLTTLDVSNFVTSNVTTMYDMFYSCANLTEINISNFDTSKVTDMSYMFCDCSSLKAIILNNKIVSSDQAMKLLNDGSNNTYLNTLSNAILYVPDPESEKLYEQAENYSTIFADSRDENGDLYRIRPMLELAGDNPVEIVPGSTYDETKDAGVTVFGFGSRDRTEYTKYGYTLSVSGLPVDTSVVGKNEVKYVLNYTKPGTTTTTKVDEIIRTINIESADISNMEITLAKDSYVYTGVEIEPQITVTNNGAAIEEGVDYVVDYTDNIDVGTATVTIIGIGNYVGIITKNFEITPAEITGYVTISGDPTYGGQLHIDFSNVVPASAELTFEWFYNLANSTEGGTRLNDNYGVPESNDILTIDRDLVGKYIYTQVTVTADNYNTKVLTAIVGPVKARNINELDAVLGQEVLVYDGNEKRPGVFIYDNYTGKELVFNTDYTLVYKDNVEVGTATVIITGDGDYKGERSLTFLIVALPTVKVENITPEWRANDTILQITIVDSGAGIHKVTFTGGTHSGDDITLTNNVATVTVDENGYYYFEVYDIYNNVVTGEALVNNIDKNAPIIENVAYDSDTFTTKVIVTVRANDMESGVYAYSISSSQSTPTTWKKLDLSENLVSFDAEITTNGTWYLFVRDLVGNVTMYDKAITIKNIDNAVPVIKLFDIAEDYTFTAEVFIQVKAEDDTGVKEILLSNQLLTTSQAESSAGWIPFTETILYTLPNKDGEHTVYAWVRDSVGKISEMASDSTMLLQKYVGNNGINSTSFKFLVKDENYDFANKLTGANIKIAVKDDNGDVTYSTDYGMNITSITLPTVYGPQQEGTQIMSGEYYTITVDNLRGKGTVCLIFDDSAIVDMAGNRLESTEIKTDVMVELNAPTISLGATEIQVSDAENNLVQVIKINDKTVLLTGGKITYAKLESDYGITLKTGDRIEAYDKCGNTSAVEVQ